MTAIDDKQLLQRIFEGLANRDGTLLVESMADDVCWRVIGTTNWSGNVSGKDAVMGELLAPLRQNLLQRSRTVAQRFLADDDFVVVEARGDNETRRALPTKIPIASGFVCPAARSVRSPNIAIPI